MFIFLAGCNNFVWLTTFLLSINDIASVLMRMRSVRGSEIVYRTENEELSLLLEFEHYIRVCSNFFFGNLKI